MNSFFVFAWEFCIEKWRGFLMNSFLVSVSRETKHEKSSKNSGKIRGKIRAENSKKSGNFRSQRALRDRLMSRGKNCLPTVSRQFLTRNYPRPNCLLKCLPNCLSPTREGFLSSIKSNPAVRVIARQMRDKTCLAAIFVPRHQSVSSGPLGSATFLA